MVMPATITNKRHITIYLFTSVDDKLSVNLREMINLSTEHQAQVPRAQTTSLLIPHWIFCGRLNVAI
jgi:hypothetical protein